jgi:hypothetical protein
VTKHITISLPLKASVLITAARPRLKEEIQSKDRDIFPIYSSNSTEKKMTRHQKTS